MCFSLGSHNYPSKPNSKNISCNGKSKANLNQTQAKEIVSKTFVVTVDKSKPNFSQNTDLSNNINYKICFICYLGNHRITKCIKFISCSLTDRVKIINEKKDYTNCLSFTHVLKIASNKLLKLRHTIIRHQHNVLEYT